MGGPHSVFSTADSAEGIFVGWHDLSVL